MMQVPDWNDYQAFLAIARAGQLARAAGPRWGWTPRPWAAGCAALKRGSVPPCSNTRVEGQVLTEAGEAMLAEVEAMERAASRIAERGGGGANGSLTGLLRVSLSEGFASWIVAPALHAFATAHPRLVIDLVASSGFLSPSKREADLAVTLSARAPGR